MFSGLVGRYRHVVALVTGDLRRYRRASEELKTAACLTPLAAALPAALHHLGVLQDPVLLSVLGLSLGLAAWVRVVDTVASLSSFRKRLEEELPFFTLASAAVSRTGLEPVELLRFLSKSRAFSSFRELGRRFSSLSEALGSSEGLSMLGRLAGGRVRLFITEYASALSSGTALQHLRDRAADFVKNVAAEVDRSLSGRMAAAMMVSTIFSVVPVVMISVTALFAASLEEGVSEPPAFTRVLAPAIASASALLAALLPGYPPATQVVVERRTLRLYYSAFCLGTALLALPPATLFLGITGLHGFRELALYTSLHAVALGLLPSIKIFRALTTSVDGVVEVMAQHVRVYRSMHLFRSSELEGLAGKPVRPWLADYLRESVEFFRVVGDVDPSVFDLFVVFVLEVERALRRTVTHVAFMTAVVLTAPVLSTATISLGAGLGMPAEAFLISYASVVSFGYVAGKVALGRNTSTLFPGLAVTLYALTLPA